MIRYRMLHIRELAKARQIINRLINDRLTQTRPMQDARFQRVEKEARKAYEKLAQKLPEPLLGELKGMEEAYFNMVATMETIAFEQGATQFLHVLAATALKDEHEDVGSQS